MTEYVTFEMKDLKKAEQDIICYEERQKRG
jgi:hypothetical protein